MRKLGVNNPSSLQAPDTTRLLYRLSSPSPPLPRNQNEKERREESPPAQNVFFRLSVFVTSVPVLPKCLHWIYKWYPRREYVSFSSGRGTPFRNTFNLTFQGQILHPALNWYSRLWRPFMRKFFLQFHPPPPDRPTRESFVNRSLCVFRINLQWSIERRSKPNNTTLYCVHTPTTNFPP